MRKTLGLCGAICVTCLSSGVQAGKTSDEAALPPKRGPYYYGAFQQGVKLGFVKTTSEPVRFKGRSLTRISVDVLIDVAGRKFKRSTEAYVDATWKPVRVIYTELGTRETVDFADGVAKYTAVKNGKTTAKEVPIPKPGIIRRDIADGLSFEGVRAGDVLTDFEFELDEGDFFQNSIEFKGKSQIAIDGNLVNANWVRTPSSRGPVDDYFDDDGVMLKQQTPTLQILRETEETEKSWLAHGGLAYMGLPRVEGLDKVDRLEDLKLEVTIGDMRPFPSDEHQTATKTDRGWTVDVHPASVDPSAAGMTLEQATKAQPEWVKPDRMVLCDDPVLVKLAKQIVGDERDAFKAACRVQSFVSTYLKYDANEDGNLQRDAREVYRSRRGVCTDFALLATTLMRAGGIPTKLVAGLYVGDYGEMGMHAWVSVFTGVRWVDLDPQSNEPRVFANYLELAAGGYAEELAVYEDQIPLAKARFKAIFAH